MNLLAETEVEHITELAYRMLRDLEDGVYDKTKNCVCNGGFRCRTIRSIAGI